MPLYRRKLGRLVRFEQYIPGRQPPLGLHLPSVQEEHRAAYVITSHGGEEAVAPGDWVGPEEHGHGFRAFKPDVFEAEYEPIGDKQEGE